MPQSFVAVYGHLVFSTKHRMRYITPPLRDQLHEYLGGIVRQVGCQPIIVGGHEDHVHILLRLGKQCTIADLLREVKRGSSRWVHETFAGLEEFAWRNGCTFLGVGADGVEAVRRYIASQEQHHQGVSFQDEYRAWLKQHHIEMDERYAWD